MKDFEIMLIKECDKIEHFGISDSSGDSSLRFINSHPSLISINLEDSLFKKKNWDSLRKQMPTEEERAIAIAVKTRLEGLSRKQIDALVKQANWLTELQIRLYLPELLNLK